MYKNYFYLLRAVIELKNFLTNKKVVECFTQEKDRLFIHFFEKIENDFHLIVDTQDFHLSIKKYFHKAKKNVINFFEEHFPSEFQNISIAFSERIIKLQLDSGNMFFFFRGNQSNVFFVNKDQNYSFKKIDKNELIEISNELDSMKFINNLDELLDLIDTENIDQQSFVPKLVKVSLDKSKDIKAQLKFFLEDIVYGKIAIGVNKNSGELIFSPLSLLNKNDEIEVELCDTYFEAIEKYFKLQYQHKGRSSSKKELTKFIEKEIERITNKLNNLKARIEQGSKEKLYQKYGELILSEINKIKKGDSEITIQDWESNEQITIKLNAKFSPQQNVNFYFDKAKSEKIEFEKSKQIYEESLNYYNKLKSAQLELEQELTEDKLKEIKKDLNIKRNQKMIDDKKEKLPFRHFLIQNKYHFYIGKDSKSNDQLTTKFAKQNDYWFHARSVAGSHGVLRIENTKEAIPKNILEKAASITAFYSKAKSSKLASVTYTLKKYVVKNSRHEPGQVTVLKEKVLLVKPEIPTDCEFIED